MILQHHNVLHLHRIFILKAFNKTDVDSLNIYLEPGDESDNTTYQTVNIHSDISHIQWGTMQPQLLGDVRWSIKESNSVYTSLLANYRVSCVVMPVKMQCMTLRNFSV